MATGTAAAEADQSRLKSAADHWQSWYCGFFRAHLLKAKKREVNGHQGHMVVTAQPVPALKVIQAEFLFKLPVIKLNAPAPVREFYNLL